MQWGTGFPWTFKVDYLEYFVLNFFSVLSMILVLVCPYSWQPYQRWDSKIVEYNALESFESTWYLILAKRLFALLSLSFIVRICCLNVRYWSSFKRKYLASLTIFIFCPFILKFIYFFNFCFFLVLKKIICVFLVFNENLFALSQGTIFWDQTLSFCWCH